MGIFGVGVDTNASVGGGIMHPGFRESKNGSITLDLYAPLKVNASTKYWHIDVKGMEPREEGRYVPIGESTTGTLRVSTTSGNVSINYIKQ